MPSLSKRGLKNLIAAVNAPPKLRESDLERTICDYLRADGWRILKTDPVSDTSTVNAIRRAINSLGREHGFSWRGIVLSIISKCVRGKGFGEKGMADVLAIRYPQANTGSKSDWSIEYQVVAEVLWLEFKRKAGKLSPAQEEWHLHERKLGALTVKFGVDCEASIEGFIGWYENSGLKRRV